MKFNFLYQKNIRNLLHSGQLSCILGKNKRRSKFDTQKLPFDVVHFDVNCIKLGRRHLKHNYMMGIF